MFLMYSKYQIENSMNFDWESNHNLHSFNNETLLGTYKSYPQTKLENSFIMQGEK